MNGIAEVRALYVWKVDLEAALAMVVTAAVIEAVLSVTMIAVGADPARGASNTPL